MTREVLQSSGGVMFQGFMSNSSVTNYQDLVLIQSQPHSIFHKSQQELSAQHSINISRRGCVIITAAQASRTRPGLCSYSSNRDLMLAQPIKQYSPSQIWTSVMKRSRCCNYLKKNYKKHQRAEHLQSSSGVIDIDSVLLMVEWKVKGWNLPQLLSSAAQAQSTDINEQILLLWLWLNLVAIDFTPFQSSKSSSPRVD